MILNTIRPNLIITGFMGTGKTAVGSVVARRLGREFVDMDQVIEERLGSTISEVFARHGEALFREKERELLNELAASSGKVVATGGGTLISDENRTRMAERGIIVNLSCSLEEILNRLENEHHRPLIEGDDRPSALRRLLEERQSQYAKIPWQIDTTSLSIDRVAEQIVTGYLRADSIINDAVDPHGVCLKRIVVDWPNGSYEVIFSRGLIAQVAKILRANQLGGPVALVTSPVVGELYGEQISESLRAAGLTVRYIQVPDGESHKNLDTVNYLYGQFIDAGIDRSSTVVTLGGGVVSDMAGYAAATFMRGLPLVHTPTTLLAQVDASVGGKVGVDHERGKNIIGAFYAPRLVLIDPLMLRSLPTDEVRSGSAEVVKSAMIRSPELFEQLEQTGGEITDDTIWECVRIKADIVSRDPFEKGERAILNFGHTIGHAIETATGYRIRHGEAVSVGMMAATRIAIEMGLCDSGVEERLGRLLTRLSLPVNVEGLGIGVGSQGSVAYPGCAPQSGAATDVDDLPHGRQHFRDPAAPPQGSKYQWGMSPRGVLGAEAVWEAMRMDKKKRGGRLRFVLPTHVGSVVISDEVPEELVQEALACVLSTGGLKLGSRP